jgi:hypothetical protein
MNVARSRGLAVTTALALAVGLWGCRSLLHSNGITVNAVNTSSQFIRSIEVDYPGGSFGIAALRPGGTRSRWVRITASGPLKVDFVDNAGEHRVAAIRLNADDSGSIGLDFSGDGKLAFSDLRPKH